MDRLAKNSGLISEICDRIDFGDSLQRSQFTEDQFANANILVSDVCNQVGAQPEQEPRQPAAYGLDETGRPADFAVYEGV